MSAEKIRVDREARRDLRKPPGIAVVIPALNVEQWIGEVLSGIPDWVTVIVVVDDGSTDRTAEIVTQQGHHDPRVSLQRHESRRGLTAAMVTGIRSALEHPIDIVVKMDGDGQMDPRFLPQLLRPVLLGETDYAKGNRFQYSGSLREMPRFRQIGNLALSFLTKAAVGYWDLFDPTNGYVAIRAGVLRQVPLESLRGYYFFETGLLAELYLLGAVVKDIPMPAIYRGEPSHMRIGRVLCEYPFRLFHVWLRRIWVKYFLLDFSIISLYLVSGMMLLLVGVIYGGVSWWYFARLAVGAPTGTVVLSAMMIILGVQLLLAAVAGDVQAVPRHPREGAPLPGADQLLWQWDADVDSDSEKANGNDGSDRNIDRLTPEN
jgi:dolichol-phosphate mannosyltransferase